MPRPARTLPRLLPLTLLCRPAPVNASRRRGRGQAAVERAQRYRQEVDRQLHRREEKRQLGCREAAEAGPYRGQIAVAAHHADGESRDPPAPKEYEGGEQLM